MTVKALVRSLVPNSLRINLYKFRRRLNGSGRGPSKLTTPSSETKQTIDNFHELYYAGSNKPLFMTTSWMGVLAHKCPLDLWIYQEILVRTRPEVIIETGVAYGGSTLYLANVCDMLGQGSVIGVDIAFDRLAPEVRSHPRIKLFEGSSTDPLITEEIARICAGRRTMVVLDSDHSMNHVLKELEIYSPLVTAGCYLIVEDTNVNGHPVFKSFGPGPMEASKEFLKTHPQWKIDSNCERLLLTFNPEGYLLRI
jgi:cephalosporin hydroxylase